MRKSAGRARGDREIPAFQRVQANARWTSRLCLGRLPRRGPARRGGSEMNRCEVLVDELKAFVDGELPLLRRTAIRAHISHCPACREEVELMEQMSNELRAGDVAALPSDLRDRLISAAPEGPAADAEPETPLWRRRPM